MKRPIEMLALQLFFKPALQILGHNVKKISVKEEPCFVIW